MEGKPIETILVIKFHIVISAMKNMKPDKRGFWRGRGRAVLEGKVNQAPTWDRTIPREEGKVPKGQPNVFGLMAEMPKGLTWAGCPSPWSLSWQTR